MCKLAGKLPSNGELQKVCITQAKKTKQREWLSEVSNIPLQQSIADLGVAYKNYFESLKGKRDLKISCLNLKRRIIDKLLGLEKVASPLRKGRYI